MGVPASVRRVSFHGCNLISSEGLGVLLRAHPQLEELEVVNCSSVRGDALWGHLPGALRSLRLNRSPFLSAPTATTVKLPSRLLTLELMHCPCVALTEAFVKSLPPSLLSLAADSLGAAEAMHLPVSLERLWLLRSPLTGCELNLPVLRSVRLGDQVDDAGLAVLCSHSSALVELDVSRCLRLLDLQSVAASLQHLGNLERLNVSANMPLSNDGVVAPLLVSGARLCSMRSAGAWAVTSAQLVNVLSVEHLFRLSFSDPRDALLTFLPRCTALAHLSLHDCTGVSARGWAALAECVSSVRVLKLVDAPLVTDEEMGTILSRAPKLEKLVLSNLAGVRGVCLRQSHLARLRQLRLTACCNDEESLQDAVSRAPLLESLHLSNMGGYSASLFRSLALGCRRFRVLSVAAGVLKASAMAGAHWIAKVPTLRSLRILFPQQLAEAVVPLLRASQLYSVELRDSKVDLGSFARLPSLSELLLPQCTTTQSDLVALLKSRPPLSRLVAFLNGPCDNPSAMLSCAPSLSYCLLQDPSFALIYTFGVAPTATKQAVSDFELLKTPAALRQSCRAIASLLAPLEARTKYACIVFFGDAWSFRLLVSLLNAGYQVICAVVESACDGALLSVFRDERLLEGVYWVPLNLADITQFQRDVAALTTHLHCVVPCYPNERLPGESNFAGFRLARTTFGDTRGLKEGLESAMGHIVISQAIIVSALSVQIRATPGCRVLCLYNGLGSITECSASHSFAMRLAFAATHMLVRYLSEESRQAIVVGFQPGPFVLGATTAELLAAHFTAPDAAAKLLISTHSLLKVEQHGCCLRYPVAILPP
jgi:hypothetical protein